jgi:hypothetical protein
MNPNTTVSYMAEQQGRALVERKLAKASLVKEAKAAQAVERAGQGEAVAITIRAGIARIVTRYGSASKPALEQGGAVVAS